MRVGVRTFDQGLAKGAHPWLISAAPLGRKKNPMPTKNKLRISSSLKGGPCVVARPADNSGRLRAATQGRPYGWVFYGMRKATMPLCNCALSCR